MRTHLYSIFVDLTKAFNKVNREGLRKIIQKFCCPERFTQMVRQLHGDRIASVTDNGAVSEAFVVTRGVKQDFVLAPTLFSLMFSTMLMDAYRNERPGIRITYRTDGQLLNHRRMHFRSCFSTNFCSSMTPPSTPPRKGHTKDHGSLRRRLQELRSDHHHGEDGGHAPTATQHSPQRAVNHREWNPNASRGQLHVSGITLSLSTNIDDEVSAGFPRPVKPSNTA
ncbi:hypothetical protein SprV_0100143200 [Sparganum proliferum]